MRGLGAKGGGGGGGGVEIKIIIWTDSGYQRLLHMLLTSNLTPQKNCKSR